MRKKLSGKLCKNSIHKMILKLFFLATFVLGYTGYSQRVVSVDEPKGTEITNSSYFGFETNGIRAKWRTSHPDNWEVSGTKKASGNKSLKFSAERLDKAITSLLTPYTISKVITAAQNGTSVIIATSYEGRVLGINYSGAIVWDVGLVSSKSTEPAKVQNNDLFAADLNNDGIDEVLVASADGVLYCLDTTNGAILWHTADLPQIDHITPMHAVCVVKKAGISYVACGNYDNSLYYLNADGSFNSEIKSSTYSELTIFGKDKGKFPERVHMANFLRPLPVDAENDNLLLLAINNHMQISGLLYQFEPLAARPINIPGSRRRSININLIRRPVGDMRVIRLPGSSEHTVIMGTSAQRNDSFVQFLNPNIATYASETQTNSGENIQQTVLDFAASRLRSQDIFYSVEQSELIETNAGSKLLTLSGNRIFLQDPNLTGLETIETQFSYNDMFKDPITGNLILAGTQIGGSCVHIVNTMDNRWKNEYQNLNPPGKSQLIQKNINQIQNQLRSFVRPSYEIPSTPNNVYFVTGFQRRSSNNTENFINRMEAIDPVNGPRVLENVFSQRYRNWDRATDITSSSKFLAKRDRRFTYLDCDEPNINDCSTQYQQVSDLRIEALNRNPNGVSFWGGHGNDPAPFSQPLLEEIITADVAKKKVFIYPELEGTGSDDFDKYMDSYLYELTETIKNNNYNTNLHIRTKHTFWQGSVYFNAWRRLLSGEFSNIFVPSMEETQDKSMELSVSGRMGIWMSGAVDHWGSRSVPDNTSYTRMRQFSSQTSPNHFLRHTIYSLANGATHFNNLQSFDDTDNGNIRMALELVARGALYVPQRSELLSISPVHLSMLTPNEDYIFKSNSVKFTVGYDKTQGEDKFVFGRLDGAFLGAKNSDWDFSTYAAGVPDRRLNFLPPYNNGMVLITPPSIPNSQPQPPRGKLTDHMHPFYTGKMKEYFTDGKYYYNTSTKVGPIAPDSDFYKTIETDIKNSANILPITVDGEVAWTVAQTDKRHLRLTLIDNGYINPKGGVVTVKINPAVINIRDLRNVLDPSELYTGVNTVNIEIPLGGFKFFDITLISDFF